MLEKVTAFVTQGDKLLLFRHPYEAIQFPAGTVEPGETAEQAAVREVYEETGLSDVAIVRYLGHKMEGWPGKLFVQTATKVYARPDNSSFDWITLRRGITVDEVRQQDDFIQIEYVEMDDALQPTHVSYRITGWVPRETVGQTQKRHFFHLTCREKTAVSWTSHTDHHDFTLFWAPLADLPAVSPYQQAWLTFFQTHQPGQN